jgi:hypothetical protein
MTYLELTIAQANKVKVKKPVKKSKLTGKSVVEASALPSLLQELKDERFKIVQLQNTEVE